MKHFTILAAALTGILACAPLANAQRAYGSDQLRSTSTYEELEAENARLKQDQRDKGIWKRQKSFNIGFVNSNWTPENLPAFKCNYGFSLSNVKTYFVHKNPIAGMLKFGIDAKWFDITYVNYKANPAWAANYGGSDNDNDWQDNIPDDYEDYYDDYEDYYGDYDIEIPNLGSHQIDVGMGIGVSAHIAPFYKFDSALNQLRASLYFHFTPTYSMQLISEEDDIRFNQAFVPYFNFGGRIQWKAISIFVEGRWGSANYKIGGFNDDIDEDSVEDGDISSIIGAAFKFDKLAARNAGIRAGIGFTF